MPQNSEPHCLHILFSDHSIKEAGSGKISLIGMFDKMLFPTFPHQTPSFVTTVAIDNFEGDLKNVKVTLRLEDSTSGHVICSVGADVNSKVPFNRNMLVEIPIRMPACQIQAPGIYTMVVLVDNEKIHERKLPITSVTTN